MIRIKAAGLFLALGILSLTITPFIAVTVARAQTVGGEPAGYVSENGITRSLTSNEATFDTARMTPAQMEVVAPHNASVVHPVPKLPIVVDGVRYAPEDISHFNGVVLRYVLDDRDKSEGVMYAFTTVKGLTTYLKDQWGWQPASAVTAGAADTAVQPANDSYWTVFYDDAYYAGSTLLTAPGAVIPDLGAISPAWNDRISSVQVSTGAAWATLYADINYGGDQLWMQRGTQWPWLASNGWDNRASSIKVWLQ
jgi:hypothetical protein